jgi:hypothetical protein
MLLCYNNAVGFLMLSDRPKAPSPKERTMFRNTYQKIAFSAVLLLLVALAADALMDNGLVKIIVLAFVVALLTLPTSWKIIFSIVQMLGMTVSFVGHGVGKVGDVVGQFAVDARSRVSSAKPSFKQEAPDWSDLQTQDKREGFFADVLA